MVGWQEEKERRLKGETGHQQLLPWMASCYLHILSVWDLGWCVCLGGGGGRGAEL